MLSPRNPTRTGRRPDGLVEATRRSAAQAGQSMVEYAITLALIAVASMVAVQALGGGIAGVFGRILGRIAGIG
jgi:Flp pilus assembly pilin Flp